MNRDGQKMVKFFAFLFVIFQSSFIFAGTPTIDPWKDSATFVCNQIKDAINFYKKGDVQKAQTQAIMSYFKGYDAELEPAVRITVGAEHVFEVEHQFRDFKNAITPNPDDKQIQAVIAMGTKLCDTLYADAAALQAAKVKKQVFNVD